MAYVSQNLSQRTSMDYCFRRNVHWVTSWHQKRLSIVRENFGKQEYFAIHNTCSLRMIKEMLSKPRHLKRSGKESLMSYCFPSAIPANTTTVSIQHVSNS